MNSQRAVFAVHPDFVIDHMGREHFVNTPTLARLYRLRVGEYIVWDWRRPATYLGRTYDHYIHLRPLSDGNYTADATVARSLAEALCRTASSPVRAARLPHRAASTFDPVPRLRPTSRL